MPYKDGNDYTTGQTFRSECGRHRVTYRPDFSASLPWASYIDGTAGQHYYSLIAAEQRMRQDYGIRIILKMPVA